MPELVSQSSFLLFVSLRLIVEASFPLIHCHSGVREGRIEVVVALFEALICRSGETVCGTNTGFMTKYLAILISLIAVSVTVLNVAGFSICGFGRRQAPFMSAKVSHDDYDPESKRIVVFGSTGRTGKKVVERLFNQSSAWPVSKVVCPVRNMPRARALFGPESFRLSLVPCDLESDNFETFVEVLNGADAVVVCSSYTPKEGSLPNLKGSKLIDNLATKRLIDACVAAGVSKVVMVSSLLTNGLNAGQLFNPQYLLLNAFGGVLIQKVCPMSFLADLQSIVK
jgi:hypothetical protein